jgi:hypothetical protein
MNWYYLLLICVVALPFTACEQHSAKELAVIEESKEKPAEKPNGTSSMESGKSPGESGPAPQYFPSSK